MTIARLQLPAQIAVVPSEKAVRQFTQAQDRAGSTSGLEALITELGQLGVAGALPAYLEQKRADWSMEVHTRHHLVRLFPTKDGHALMIGAISPIAFRDQEKLARHALVLRCPAGWWLFPQLVDVPRNIRAPWPLLVKAWTDLQDARPPGAMPPHHETFLDLLTEVVEASRDIETKRQRDSPPVPYRQKSSTREERHSTRGVYAFTLLRPGQLSAGSMINLSCDENIRGRVLAVRDSEVVIRFEPGVDYRRIPEQGTLRSLPSDRVFRTQLETVDALRRGKALDPTLLAAIVDGVQHPYQPDPHAQPCEPLDEDQLGAFRRALTVPDQLLVLGPPGTGKTRTITQIAIEAAARRQRVLITSHTNRAVDNVLEKLPGSVLAIRIGNEDTMTGRARRYMLEAQVDTLREDILAATAAEHSRLAIFSGPEPVPARFLAHLDVQLGHAASAEAELRRLTTASQAVVNRVTAPLRPQLAAAETALAQAQAHANRAVAVAQFAWTQLTDSEAKAQAGALAFVHRWIARRRRQRWQERDAAARVAGTRAAAADEDHGELRAHVDALIAGDSETHRIEAARTATTSSLMAASSEVADMADQLRSSGVGRHLPALTSSADVTAWQGYREAVAQELALLRCRAGLLAEWRGRVDDAASAMQREMVRYAEIVAATCIGTATSGLLDNVEFDLAIVDEAGQISTPNLLVPLIRARRSVLVGDHRQLPPFLDHEVESWASSRGADTDPTRHRVLDLLRRSTFEMMYGARDDLHRVMLRTQRRMPEAVAEFVSTTFYRGLLQTVHPGGPADPVFNRTFAMIDTSDRPLDIRRERRTQGTEPSYENELEAALITALIGCCVERYEDWAVIVPFAPQVRRLTRLLNAALGGADVSDCVGTVDSFQGGERDLIVYGFTRSNNAGNVGFLKELRRVNVAISRARRQLVVVGDRATLCAAKDTGFATLARGMVDYLGRDNAIHASQHIEQRLARRPGGDQ